jgi:RNA polymerase sigma-70 factor (ECF subfamily)
LEETMSPVAQNPPEDGREAEERLLIEAARKDPTRFAELYERHVDRVFAYVARRVHDRFRAEDVTSDVFHRALAGLPRFEWRGVPFAAWLYRIAANEIADLHARSAREASLVDPNPGTDLSDSGESDAAGAERRACVARALEDLPGDQRRVVHLRFFEQKSIREVAEEIGRSPGAVKQLQFRALETLRAHAGEHLV